jgi:hypothetical protein
MLLRRMTMRYVGLNIYVALLCMLPFADINFALVA